MIIKKHIKQIENLLNKEKIIKYEILQISFNIACVKFELASKKKYIAKFSINIDKFFNPIKSEAKNLIYLNNLFNFFPKLINWNNKYLVIQYITNDKNKPVETNSDILKSVVELHSISNNLFGFDFNTQMGALEQINTFEESWVNFYLNNRLIPMFELANKKENMGKFINEKIYYIFKNLQNFIPNHPKKSLLHGDLWEGNILFQSNKFTGFIDPGSFFGHNEMEIAYLRWFNPSFIDSNFLEKYSNYIKLEKNYLDYERIYQLYYALCNVALWDKSYVEETKKILIKLKI
jgi:fructosamine-3-kinase